MRTVHVVSWVYWNGDEQGGGGFVWFDEEDLAAAVTYFHGEKKAWAGTPARIRLVTTEVPVVLTPEGVTDYLDWDIDQLEVYLPARKVALVA